MKKNKIPKIYGVDFDTTYIFIAIFLICYQILTSMFMYLPILYGVFFCYMFFLLEEKQKNLNKLDFRWYFSLFFLLFTDITHNFYLFSSWGAFLVFYYTCADWIKTNFKIGKLILPIFVLFTYVLIFMFDVVFSYMGNENLKFFGLSYIYSIIIEGFFSYIFFKDKI